MIENREHVEFTVVGDILTKQRPRATVVGGHARVYTPNDTINYENYIKSEYQRQTNEHYFKDKPLFVSITAKFKVPKAIEKLQKKELIPCINKKDLDNIAKIILDSLNGIAYEDDRQIVYMQVMKEYTSDEKESVVVAILDLSNDLWSIEKVKANEIFCKDVVKLEELNKKCDSNGGKLNKTDTEKRDKIAKRMQEYIDKYGLEDGDV